MLRVVAVAALTAGAVLALRKRSAARGDEDLWAEAARSPDAVHTTRR